LFGPEGWGKVLQSERNRRITFRWEKVMQTVPRVADLFKEFLLKWYTFTKSATELQL